MLARCGRVAHICEANNKTAQWNCNKNLRENRKESQLPSKSKDCNEIQGFRGNCDSQGKLGMCPSLAEPDWGGFSKNRWFSIMSRRKIKVFCSSNFSKMLARCGRVAHICEANRTCTMKYNKNLRSNRKNRNCLERLKVVMRYKVSGAIAIP